MSKSKGKELMTTTATLGLPADLSGLAKFAASGGDDDVGDRLRVNGKTGAITSGSQGFEHKPGEQFAFFIGEARGGWVRFDDGDLVNQGWIRLADPDADLGKLRNTLGDNDPNEWKDVLPNGLPKDPYNRGIKIPCINPKTGKLYTFSSLSFHGVKATRRLIQACLVQQRAAPATTNNHVPVVALGVATKSTKNGPIFFPAFEVTDWVPIGHVLHSLAKAGNAGAFGMTLEETVNEDLGEEPQTELPPPAKPARSAKSTEQSEPAKPTKPATASQQAKPKARF